MTVEKICGTCRFDCTTPGSYENPPDWGCTREDEIGMLCDLWNLDDVEWGATEPCPLWESFPISVCQKHGPFPADDICVECIHPETEGS